jgi:hypothetical protein
MGSECYTRTNAGMVPVLVRWTLPVSFESVLCAANG